MAHFPGKKNKFFTARTLEIVLAGTFVYFIGYCARKYLSIYTPQLLSDGRFTSILVSSLSTVFMLSYALGQLANGVIGDRISAQYMVSVGMFLSGLGLFCFPLMKSNTLMLLCFALFGYGQSMHRGPLVRMYANSFDTETAKTGSMLLTLASYFAAAAVGFIAIFLLWNRSYTVTGLIFIICAVIWFFLFCKLEKRGWIYGLENTDIINSEPVQHNTSIKNSKLGVHIFIAAAVEIMASSAFFWFPYYCVEVAEIPDSAAKVLFSSSAILESAAVITSIRINKLFHDNDLLLSECVFISIGLIFVIMIVCPAKKICVLLFMLAKAICCFASTVLWSVYIPGLRATGKVSTANGIIDFMGYISASAATSAFAFIMVKHAWNMMFIIIAAVFFISAIACAVSSRKT